MLENIARRYLSPSLARLAKRFAVHPRYAIQARACRDGFRRFGDRYPQPVLFIAGLPKSGTTWLKKMISAYPGFHELLIPDVASYELVTGGSHDYDLPSDMFRRFEHMLVVTKMHVHGSPHNVELLRQAGVHYVILYRDLRDVAVSHYFYVRRTPWHPEYPLYAPLAVGEALVLFAKRTLLPYVAWVRSWRDNGDSELGLVLRYEDLLADTLAAMRRVSHHFGLDDSPDVLGRVVASQSFEALAGGRQRGEQSSESFFRKGVAGDWRNHFPPAVRELYKHLIGAFLVEVGYEQDLAW